MDIFFPTHVNGECEGNTHIFSRKSFSSRISTVTCFFHQSREFEFDEVLQNF